MTREEQAAVLNLFPEVAWDRFTEHEYEGEPKLGVLTAFGWIARDDGRSDFLVLELLSDGRRGFTTSSAALSAEFSRRLNDGEIGDHVDCQRVESVFGELVPRAVRLHPPAQILVAIPVLGRPERVEGLVASLERGRGAVPYRALFLASPGDSDERRALDAAGADYVVVPWPAGPGDWARKLNLAYRESSEPWIFTGADDLCFCPGWADAALEGADASPSPPGVVGTNDLGNPSVLAGVHATHCLVRRSYVDAFGTIDEPGLMLHEGYDHQFVDNELVATAKKRGAWLYCPDSMVEHLHPHWGKAGDDATYAKGQAQFAADRRLFQKRSSLWATR